MIILLPPSEGKSPNPGHDTFSAIHPDRVAKISPVLAHLRTLSPDFIGKFYAIKDPEKAEKVQERNLDALSKGCIPALQRYTGVVYTHLDYATLRAKKRAGKSIHIVSGLFGLIPGCLEIPEYKMPMNTWLRHYWQEINTQRLALLRKKSPVISLLPQVYGKALDLKGVHPIDFKVSGGKKLAGHHGKAIKGKFVRFLIENDIKSMDEVGDFREDGFAFNGQDFIQP